MGKAKRCPVCGHKMSDQVAAGLQRDQAQCDQDLYDISAEWWQKGHPLPWVH